MQDWLPERSKQCRHLVDVFQWIAELYQFSEINTPLLETSDLYTRSLGDVSDVVNKEMYAFEDRSGNSLCLRPEGTASVVRALVSNNITTMPQRLWYYGPMFRYERPQRGRHRQFHQFGVELFGVPSVMADVEVIEMAYRLLLALGLGHRVVLRVNSLGTPACQERYADVLQQYLESHRGELSDTSVERLDRRAVLRVLDSKAPQDQGIIAGAPSIIDSLSGAALQRFSDVQGGLEAVGVPFVVDPRLVRGLDYYCHTAFEFEVTGTETSGPVGTVLAGGRYDGLVSELGGADVCAVGWAAGLERLAELSPLAPPTEPPVVVVVPLKGRGDNAKTLEQVESDALRISQHLRDTGVHVRHMYSARPAGKQLKRATRAGAQVAVMVGNDEAAAGCATLKLLSTGKQMRLPLPLLADAVQAAVWRLAHPTPRASSRDAEALDEELGAALDGADDGAARERAEQDKQDEALRAAARRGGRRGDDV